MNYKHRPTATGMHAKLLSEARKRSPYITARSASGLPGHIVVTRRGDWSGPTLWSGHRDLLPTEYRHAFDPFNVLTRPASD